MLVVSGLTKTFGGVTAVQDVGFKVAEGAIHSVIGPNGAGKTTLFNLITGVYTPTRGDVIFGDESVVGKSPDQLARRGMCRTFQNLQICMNMSALANVMVGAHLGMNQSFLVAMLRAPALRRAEAECRDRCVALMEFVGNGRYVKAEANQMPYGALKRLEIARALAAKPKMLLLDEPAAGLNHTETAEVSELIRKIADSGITVLLVEHDIKFFIEAVTSYYFYFILAPTTYGIHVTFL